MADLSAQQILVMRDNARAQRGEHGTRLDSLAKVFYPSQLGFQSEKSDGEQLARGIRDSFGQSAAEKLSNFLFNNTMGGANRWFSLNFEDDGLDNDDSAKRELQDREERLYGFFEESNFYSVIPEAMRGLVVFGTMAGACDLKLNYFASPDAFPGLVFRNIWLKDIDFLPDSNGEMTVTFVTLELTGQQALERYGDALCDEIRKAAVESPAETFEFIWAVYPRYANYEEWAAVAWDSKGNPKPVARGEQMPFAATHVCVMKQEVVQTSGYMLPPRGVFLYEDCPAWPGSWGYGPGDKAYGDMAASNRLHELEERAVEKNVDPGYFVGQNNMLGDLDHSYGAMTEVRDVGQIRNMNEGTRFDVVFAKKEEWHAQIAQQFHLDLIALPDAGTANMTAYEVSVRRQFMVQTLGPVAGRLQAAMKWLVQRAYLLAEENGGFEDWSSEIGGSKIDVSFNGPLPLAQRMQKEALTDEWVSQQVQWATATENPTILDNVDFDEYSRRSARARGVDEDILRDQGAKDTKTVADLRGERQQAAEAAQKAQTLETATKGISNIADAKAKAGG